MSNLLIIERKNKKALEALKKLQEAKAALRSHITSGGNVKDYYPKKSKSHNS